MEQTKKTVFRGTEPFDYHADEQLCENMAGEGWLLDSLTPYTTTFVKALPSHKKFRVDIYPDAHLPEKKKALEAYKNEWRKAGYKYIANNDLYFYFCSDEENTKEPDTAGKYEKSLIHSAVWRKELYTGLIVLLVILYGAIRMYSSAYTDFVTYSGFSKVFLPIFALPLIIRLIPLLIRFIKNKNIIARGEKLPFVPYKTARRRWRFTFALLIAMMAWILLGIILDACTGSPQTMLLLSPVAITAAVFYFVKGMKKRGGSRLVARLVIIAAIILCIGGYAVFNFMEFPADSVASSEYIRHLDSEISSKKYTRTKSPFVRDHYSYTEWDKDGNKADTEVFDCTSVLAADIIYGKIEKRLAGTTVEDYELERNENIIVYTDLIPAK